MVEHERKENFPEEATEAAVLLRDLVKEAHDDVPLHLVPPHWIINHDDNTQYFFEGVYYEKNEIVITHTNSYEKRNCTCMTPCEA